DLRVLGDDGDHALGGDPDEGAGLEDGGGGRDGGRGRFRGAGEVEAERHAPAGQGAHPQEAATVEEKLLHGASLPAPVARGGGRGGGGGLAGLARGRRDGTVDGGADAEVGGATTQVVAHRLVDLGVRRTRGLREERRRRHDLPRLAVAALRDLQLLPGPLDRVGAGGGEPLDGGDRRVGRP